ncbi:MAG: adenylate cyclase [Gammaproteobacteria bacterium]|jgi:adenylate cyclase
MHACSLSTTLRTTVTHCDAVGRQLSIIREVFGKYVPEAIATAIVESEGLLEPREAIGTILFTDIESFTTITETVGPERVVKMLNEYFHAVIEPIERHGGVVNQFQGDAMLVTFNVPAEDPHHADQAIQAARDIAGVCATTTFGGVRLRTRIGINTGPLVAGNVGSGQRMNHTVHGDAVYVAARLEAMNKEQGTTVLVSGDTVRELDSTEGLRSVGELPVRGKDKAVEVYALDVDSM